MSTNRHIITSFFIYLVLASSALLFLAPWLAQGQSAAPTTVPSLETTLQQVNEGAQLPAFEETHYNASLEPGANTITSAILFAVDLIKYLVATIAVIVIIASGVRLITAGKQIEEVSSQQKENLKYAFIGLIVIFIADALVRQVFFGEQGEVFRSEADAQLAAERGSEQFLGIYNLFQIFVGALAILMIVISGVRMVTSAGNQETVTKGRRNIMWALAALILIAVSEFVVKDIIFPDQGNQLPDLNQARSLIVDITNFVSGFVATVAIAFYMYGGLLYVGAGVNEEQLGKAKKIFIGATIGLLLALGAFALVNTFITFDPGTDAIPEIPTELPV